LSQKKPPEVLTTAEREALLASQNPQNHDEHAHQEADDKLERFVTSRRVFGRNVPFAVRAAFGVFVNLLPAVGAGNGGFVIVFLWRKAFFAGLEIFFVIAPGFFAVGVTRHGWPRRFQFFPEDSLP
jgi:hypothetical protein